MRKITRLLIAAAALQAVAGCAQVQDVLGNGEASRPLSERSMVSVARLDPEEMLGKPVLDFQGEEVGQVEDVLFGRSGNRPTHLVVSSGGLLGIGARNVALDVDNVRYARDREAIVATQFTKEQIANLPEFDNESGMVSLSRSRSLMNR
ncbi:PRC-barrel domain-containing protein [Azospirillum sp. SYSU D00513]|uniref:PRC-barrel domain-containing protein n=1 Tax=Azospirillum sp. SYSU D00513 TaxID=2812561 RepID=UPI001A9594B9|nr:PRC-barrel domain-containing protein [Azospirillum sp. SYSU D00513]